MKFIERLLSALAWLQIAISPTIVGAVAGVLIWLKLRDSWGVTLGAAVVSVGFVTGVAIAEKARRNKGTIEFMSRNIAHPELREKESMNDTSRTK